MAPPDFPTTPVSIPKRTWVKYSERDRLSEEFHGLQLAQTWTWEEHSFGGENASSKNLPEWLRKFLVDIFVYFTPIDVIVAETGLQNRLMKHSRSDEEAAYWRAQASIEDVHSKVYRNLLEAYITDDAVLRRTLDRACCARDHPEIESLLCWAEDWLSLEMEDKEEERQKDLLALASVEGIGITGNFPTIVYIGTLGFCSPTVKVNDQISKDENLHYHHAMAKYRQGRPLPKEFVVGMITSLIKACEKFVRSNLAPTKSETNPNAPPAKTMITQENLIGYYRFLANDLFYEAGLEPFYKDSTVCPLPFMTKIMQGRKENFFEVLTVQYHIGTKQIVDYSVDPFMDPLSLLGSGTQTSVSAF